MNFYPPLFLREPKNSATINMHGRFIDEPTPSGVLCPEPAGTLTGGGGTFTHNGGGTLEFSKSGQWSPGSGWVDGWNSVVTVNEWGVLDAPNASPPPLPTPEWLEYIEKLRLKTPGVSSRDASDWFLRVGWKRWREIRQMVWASARAEAQDKGCRERRVDRRPRTLVKTLRTARSWMTGTPRRS